MLEFHYDITIKGTQDVIVFEYEKNESQTSSKSDAIQGVNFKFNSDDETKERDRNGRVEIIINGKFDDRPETLVNIQKLSEWSRSREDVYREVTIDITTIGGVNNFKRTLHFDKMFCIDYTEQYGKEGGSDDYGLSFELFMAQAPTYQINETFKEYI